MHFYRPTHTTVPTCETNSRELLSICCKVFSAIATWVWHISLASRVDYMRIFVYRNTFRVHLNIKSCTSRILRQQKQTFEQIYSIFYEIQHSPPLSIKTWRYLWTSVLSVTTDIRTNYWYTWLLAFTNYYTKYSNVPGTPVTDHYWIPTDERTPARPVKNNLGNCGARWVTS